MSYVGGEYLLEISPSKGLEVSPGGFRLFAALAQALAVESEDLLLQTRQAGHSDAVVFILVQRSKSSWLKEGLLQLRG